ncbi:MAG TPA: rhamnogalacturonan acetylesterase [Bryobacteraceae bacterium]|nr:rhamnogalacturonan acetylesterase [Bryobacteraceae bacterium]
MTLPGTSRRWMLAALLLGGGIGLAQTPAPPPAPAPAPAANAEPSWIAAIKPDLPTLFVAGDSTAKNGDRLGWGDPFSDYFDLTRINVANAARAGRSARTFFNEGLWQRIVDHMKPGDYVLIQFGHNDGGAPDKRPFRGDVPGIGEETQSVTMPNGTTDVVHSFGWYIRKFINDTKAKGAHPIVMSCTVRNIWTDGKIERHMGNFREWSKQVADAENVPYMDFTEIAADRFEQMGQEQVKPLFPIDHTHTSPVGADLNASLVVSGLKAMKSPLTNYLSAKGEAVAAYTPHAAE